MSAGGYTTISVDPDFRDYIRSHKRGQESYTEVLSRVFEEAGYPDPNDR